MLNANILGERARLTPDKTALVFVPTRQRFTYQQLDERAIRCARLLTETCGLRKGDRAGILANNSVEFLDAFFAAAKSGIVLVPLNTHYTAHELEYIMRDSGLQVLLYQSQFRDTLRPLEKTAALKHWVALDAGGGPGDLSYGESVAALHPAGWSPVRCDPEDLFCLLYTSGTTGRPKGVMTPHRMAAWNGYNTAVCWQLREDDVSPVFTPLYHAGGLGAFLMPIFTIGGTIVLHGGFDTGEIWRTIEKEKCTVVLGVPTIYKLLMEAPEFQQVDLRHVRWFACGGAPLPLHVIETYQKRGVVLKQGYGLTEVGVNCFSMTAEESARKAGSIGKPLMFTQARLVDAQGNDVPVGEVGELLLRGPHVCQGYWNNPQATAAALDPGGWFHTGDLARCDEEGFFYIAGRSKDMFISGGVNVYPAEIEGELLLHSGVQDAAVVGVPHPTWGEVGVAFVVRRAPHNATAEELAHFLGERLARYKVPKEFLFVDALPRTPYGKVVKGELLLQYRGRKAPDSPGD
ncbi:MAG: long-chain fatty acid--CoA ligase [Acidobacteriia bacterium]|nr:long-chain fatty acid--CoA ligase [Terriglobia bacterium]